MKEVQETLETAEGGVAVKRRKNNVKKDETKNKVQKMKRAGAVKKGKENVKVTAKK